MNLSYTAETKLLGSPLYGDIKVEHPCTVTSEYTEYGILNDLSLSGRLWVHLWYVMFIFLCSSRFYDLEYWGGGRGQVKIIFRIQKRW